jgi:hypothetical protein
MASPTIAPDSPEFRRVMEEVRNRYLRRPALIDTDTTLNSAYGEARVDATDAAITITLPLAENQIARDYTIKKVDAGANAVTVQASGSDLIDGATSVTLSAQYDSVTVKSNGDGTWDIIARVGSGSGGTWSLVKKTADETTAADTALTADSDLVVPLLAGSKYHVRGRIFFGTTVPAMGYKYGFNLTGAVDTTTWHRRHSALGAAAGTDSENTQTGRGSLPSSVSVP